MIRKELLIILITFCLTATLFSIIPVGSQGVREYDPWYDMNDDGIIDLWDVYHMNMKYGTEGTPINKTDLFLQLLAKIDQLNVTVIEQQSIINNLSNAVTYLNETLVFLNSTKGLGPPDYDSGWTSIPWGQWIPYQHGLNTTNLLVYIIGKDSNQHFMHQYNNHLAIAWEIHQSPNEIFVSRTVEVAYDSFRIFLWKIPQP